MQLSLVRPRNLSTLLLLAITVVVIVGAATAWIVAVGIGPTVFHQHMMQMGGSMANTALHAEEAFRTASTLSLGIALLAALLASVAVTVFLTRRITKSLEPVAEAAGRVAAGDYTARIPAAGVGSEFDNLTIAFNTMADELGRIETTRTQLLGDLAHEMRTPVTTIGAYLEAIADGVQPANAATLEMLSDQVTRLTRLSEDISLVSTAEEGRLTMRRTSIGVAQLVTAAVKQAAAQYSGRGVTLETQLAPQARAAMLEADADRIGQVLTNLLDNALRHTPEKGTVRIIAKLDDHDHSQVTIAVSDNGSGIPPEHLPHVFDRFYRVDTSRDRLHGGSGVGLAIARAITAAHGGTIRAESPGTGRGTVFTMTLPLAQMPRESHHTP